MTTHCRKDVMRFKPGSEPYGGRAASDSALQARQQLEYRRTRPIQHGPDRL
ncbi:hypothetical protein [Pseudomonas paraveronii]|uniref:hypothetical protein n=1 Tax=Pseudomonas paraveronii TaxID=3040598 RepID=UPI002AB0C29A|nr:hypothetical protein [Pseudomonas sp. V3/K/3/5]